MGAIRNILIGAAVTMLTTTSAVSAETKVRMIGFGGASNLPVWQAIDKGIFKKHGLDVTLDRTKGSEAQIKDMMAGKYDIASTSIDNIIAYTEGQGPFKVDNFDMVAFAGVHSGLNSVVTRPEIKSYADIKGKPVAVDAPNTGYAFVLFRILENNGLKYKQDYTVVSVGGGPERLAALKENKAIAAVMSAPNDIEAKEAGFNILADAASELGGYQGSVYGVRRDWAKANEKTLISFIQAIVESQDRIFSNKADAIDVLKKRIKGLDDKEAETVYASLTSGKGGLNPKAAINVEGVKTVLSLRGQYAEPKMNLTDPNKYIDLSYYNKAIKAQ